LSFGKSLAALIEGFFVPGRGLNDFWSTGKILPERLHDSKLLPESHVFERKIGWHKESILQRRMDSNP
jgi:hypothetical protein